MLQQIIPTRCFAVGELAFYPTRRGAVLLVRLRCDHTPSSGLRPIGSTGLPTLNVLFAGNIKLANILQCKWSRIFFNYILLRTLPLRKALLACLPKEKVHTKLPCILCLSGELCATHRQCEHGSFVFKFRVITTFQANRKPCIIFYWLAILNK